MREIKFRAWHKEEKLMGEAVSISFDTEFIDVSLGDNFGKCIKLSEIELMQSTGTYDDDKNEIYKGDIIFCDNEDGFCLYLVEFGEYERMPEAVFKAFYLKPIKQYEFFYEKEYWAENDETAIEIVKKYNLEYKNFVIIGNIYENPELLEV